MNEAQLIAACKRQDRKAQQMLYERFAPRMFGVCKRFVSSRADAEDLLVAALYKALTNLSSYTGNGSFEGWIRRIVINECLMFLRKRHDFSETLDISELELAAEEHIEGQLAAQELMALVAQLPDGYRTIFNLYVMEGYKHREIADQLNISIHTSKSQLLLAKRKLKAMILAQQYPHTG